MYCCPTQIAAVVNDTNLQLSAVVKGYGEVFNPAHIEPYLQALCISVDSEVFNEGSKKYIKELTQLQSKVSEEMAGRVDVCAHLGLVDVCAHLGLVDVCAHLGLVDVCTHLGLVDVCTHLGLVDVCAHLGLVDVCTHLGLVDVCAHLGLVDVCTPGSG